MHILYDTTKELRILLYLFLQSVKNTPHPPPPDQKPSNAPIFVHSSAGIQHPKEKPSGGGWGILNKKQKGVRGTDAR
jgi:hypothetical protein